MVEVPRNDSIEFALSVLAAFDSGPSHVGRRVPIHPLLSEHREEGGEEGSGETCEEDSLDVNDGVRRAGPLWKGGRFVSEGGVIDLVDKNAEESGGLVIRVRLEVGVDLDDECGGDGREQTSLRPLLAPANQNPTQNAQISVSCSSPHHISL